MAWQDRTDLGAQPASGDTFLVNDVSDPTDNAAGTVKEVPYSFVAGRPTVKFLTSDTDQNFDVSTAEYGTYRTGSGWTATRTITFINTPPNGAWYLISNNSGQDLVIQNGTGTPLDIPIDPFTLKNGETITFETYAGTSKLIKVDRGWEVTSSRVPPFGGGAFTVLMKNTGGDHDFAWKDIDDITEDTTPDVSADTVMTFDQSAGQHRKVLLSNLPYSRVTKWVDVVADYGAVGNGVADDTTAIQNAINSGADVVFFPDGDYLVTTVDLPLNRGFTLLGAGRGSIITSTTGAPMIRRIPADQTAAITNVNQTYFIRNLTFDGNRTAGQIGLQLCATYGSVVEGCFFTDCDIGLDLQFGLMTAVRNCLATNNGTYGLVARNGTWTGATSSNSQSNHTVFTQCRVYCFGGQAAGFFVDSCSGVSLDHCVVEGANPVVGVDFTDGGSTVVKNFRVKNLHVECAPTTAAIRFALVQGKVNIDGIYWQTACVLLDSTGTGNGTDIVVRGLDYWVSGTTFNHDAGRWTFKDSPAFNQYDTANWVGAALPFYLYAHFRSDFTTPRALTLDSPQITVTDVFADAPGKIRFREDPGNGTDYVALSAPSSVTTSRTHTLPEGAGDDTVALLAASQTLTNKTIDASLNTLSNLPITYETLNANGDVGTGADQVAAGNHTHAQLHDRSHTMTSTSDHTATNWRMFYSNGTAQVVELALAATGNVLLSNGTTSAPTFGKINNTHWSGTDLSVANGGTGVSTLASGELLTGAGTGAVTTTAIPAGGLVGVSATQTLTGKTISGGSNTLSNIAISSVTNLQTTLDGKQPLDTDLTTLASAFTTASAAGSAELALAEDTDNGANTLTLKGPASVVSTNKTATFQDVTGTVYVTDGQDVAVADGGTGASDATTARSNLGAQQQGDVLDDMNALPVVQTDGQLIVATGTGAFTYENANSATFRATLASGTASSTTYLRGDGTWATPAGSGGGDFTTVTVAGTADTIDGTTNNTHRVYTSSSPVTVTLSTSIPTDGEIVVRKSGSGAVTLSGSGMTLNGSASITLTGTAFIKREGSSTDLLVEGETAEAVTFEGAATFTNGVTLTTAGSLDVGPREILLDDAVGGNSGLRSNAADQITFKLGGSDKLLLDGTAGNKMVFLGGFDLDMDGNPIEGHLSKVVTGVNGTLNAGDHSGNVLVTTNNVTVPQTVGFNCLLVAGGAHTVTFNGTTNNQLAAGDMMSIVVQSSTVIKAVITASSSLASFT